MIDPHRLHDRQRAAMDGDRAAPGRESVHDAWLREDTVWAWRHKRLFQAVAPLSQLENAKWVTVGDGRYGLDACRLRQLYGVDVLATDIAGGQLQHAVELGLVPRFQLENAERLSFPDSAFDVVFCKDAYHHFPRPYLAMYEMLRVARQAVVLIEPKDPLVFVSPRSLAQALLPLKLGGGSFLQRPTPNYESSGNYVYSLSIRETVRLCQGIDLPGFAWKGFNDEFIQGCEFEPATNGNPMFERVKRSIARKDRLCRWFPGFHDYDIAAVILFKTEPTAALRVALECAGYTFPTVTRNPYVS